MKIVSLRTRLTLLLALAALVSLGIAAKVVDWRADSEMQQRFDASLLARAQAFAALVHSGHSGIEIDAVADRAARFPGGSSNDWYAVTCHGHAIAQSDPAPPRVGTGSAPRFANARLADGRELRVVALHFQPMPGEDQDAAAPPRDTPDCIVRYGLDRGPLDDILHTLDWILLGSIFGACALVLVLTPWLVRRGLRPLAVLNQAMAGIGPDSPGGRLPASSTKELAPLVTRFNDVLVRMDAGLARERQFASGLAHEFRTRIAELRTLVDVELRHPSGRGMRDVLGDVGSISRELEATVTALLQLTRIQSGLERPRPESIPLGPLLARIIARHREAAQAANMHVQLDLACDSAFTLEADPTLLEIVLDNLLGNAVAYAPAQSAITLHATSEGIELRNSAPTLRPDDLANFGQRFWRKGTADTAHAGLGLALAGVAARAMGMRLEFTLHDRLLRAKLRFPPA